MKNIIGLLLITLLLFSCKEEPKNEEQLQLESRIETYDSLMKEAIKAHDVIMPDMGRLLSLKKKLEAQKIEGDQAMEIENVQMDLQKAYDDMFTWMEDYSSKFPYGEPSPSTAKELNKKMPILEEEVKEIKELKDFTLQTIEKAEILLQK
ncbi:hypothetical protein BST91_10410 [Nonlabens tegetincola]|uniref:hypothetical protein n=1 Tax=Nonlabens tegetincola TaxID=323273 RepID=UPI000A209798|nr:hypothetical protein [Nonlabens tegetincola]ARN72035.1 hypothetical protein BST91_10410 [Nonlabens tegetincola]